MLFKQYYLGCLAHASYLIADDRTQTAVVVDPQRDIDEYLRDAAAGGYTIRYVLLTHFHADFLAGHIELRNRTGATIGLGRRAEAEFDFLPLHDGQLIEFGDVRLQVLETPGHTPEGVSIVVYDAARDASRPHTVLTGDTLFIGDVGRPDLLASIGVTAEQLADMLYDSLDKLRQLPDETLVYPAHGAGSMCGKNLSKETVSTMGEQKRFNYALQPMDREAFRKLVTADQPEAPEYFVYDAIRNRQERPDLQTTMTQSLRSLTLDEVLRQQAAGAQVVDVREGVEFEAAHLAGAVNIGLQGKYATWCGTVLDRERPILIVAEPGQEAEAVMRLGRIGFDNVVGVLAAGMRALDGRPELLRSVPRLTALELAAEMESAQPPVVVDVRSAAEWRSGHLAGSRNVPLPHLRERLAEVPADVPVVVHCEGGYRSAIAASLLSAAGRTNVRDLVGGVKAWVASRLPLETSETAAAAG